MTAREYPQLNSSLTEDWEKRTVRFHPAHLLITLLIWIDTSKFYTEEEVHGRRGSFLASLASLSLLTITSHHLRHQSTNTVIFHHSSPIARLIPAPIQHGLRFSGHGTCVTVNDLFGNIPVRVKSRALVLQKPDEVEREWENLKQLLVALMVANDQLIKLVLSDGSRSRKVTLRPQTQNQQAGNELDVQRISSTLAQAGLANFQNPDCWKAVSACVPDFSIHAAICLVPSPTKRGQFISLGMVPVFPQNSANLLYNEINNLFSSSEFGTLGAASTSVQGSPDTDQTLNSKTMPKATNKWPTFYIRINTNTSQRWYEDGVEIAPESDKSIQHILDVLGAMLNELLTQLNLRPRAGKRKRKAPQESQGASRAGISARRSKDITRQDRPEPGSTEEALDGRLKLPSFKRVVPNVVSQHFGDWSRIKGAKEPILDAKLPASKSKSITPGIAHRPIENIDIQATHSIDEKKTTDTTIPWTDPYTGRVHMINSRTGQSVNPVDEFGKRPHSTGLIQPKQALDRVKRPMSAMSTGTQNSWIDGLLKKWENPTFGRAEMSINSIDAGASHGQDLGRTAFETHDCSGDLCGLDTVRFSKFRGKLRRQDLESAEVVAQVDQKFILAKLPSSSAHDAQSGAILALIDQHAADERCRVERLYGELFTSTGDWEQVQTISVEPIMFEAPVPEKSLFKRHRRFFRSWGVEYRVEQGSNSRLCVSVHSLPSLIAERCRTEPNLVPDLIRGEIWRREENGKPGTADLGHGSHHNHRGSTKKSWVERLNGCPQGLLDLLNSRACRTAIMFNDVLSVSECQQLVSQLAQCVFPFQCAHGRPSMVPILDMESSSSSSVGNGVVGDFLAGSKTGLDFLDEYGYGDHGDGSSSVGFVEKFERAYT